MTGKVKQNRFRWNYSPHTSILKKWKANQWHHIAISWDKVSGQKELYIDGVLNDSNSNGGIILTSSAYGAIGRRIFYATNYFRGSLDEVKIFNKAYDNLIDVNLLRIGQNPR
jgi:hypothetical protein